MSDFIKELQEATNETFTENGAKTFASTGNHCLDLFAMIGALRNSSARRMTDLFERAYAEDKDIAMKILFFARDIRRGLGERNTFRTIIRRLANTHPLSVSKNIQ